jgi:hypothetical protein
MKTQFASLLAGVCLLATGCASVPQMPAEFDLGRASIAPSTQAPALALEGPDGKGRGAGVGAAKGGGLGFVIGGLACLGTGPFSALCLGTVVPAGMAVGAASGAVVGAVRAESADDVQAKRSLLQAELATPAVRMQLAAALQQQSRELLLPALPLAGGDAAAASTEWTLQIAVTEVATVGSGPGVPYALLASARLAVLQRGQTTPVFVNEYQAQTANSLTTPQWAESEGAPLRAALQDLSAKMAAKMLADLAPPRRLVSR